MRKPNSSGPSRRRRTPDSDSRKGGHPAGNSEGNPFRKEKNSGADRPSRKTSAQNSSFSPRRSDTPRFDKQQGGPKDPRKKTYRSFDKDEDSKRPINTRKDEGRPFRGGQGSFTPDSKRGFGKGARPQGKRTSSFSGSSKEDRYRKSDKPGFREGSSFKDSKPSRNRMDAPSSAPGTKRGFDRTGSKPNTGRREALGDDDKRTGQRPGQISVRGFTRSGSQEKSDAGKPPRKRMPDASKHTTHTAERTSSERGDKIRLNKFIANSGVCSRRDADELIKMGLISVNGKTITELGYKINRGDEVRHENKVLKAEKPVYVLLNKPKGFLTTTADPQERRTVMQLVGNLIKERVYPVGRLDRNTTGLLLLTNDGELAERLMHPSHNVKKIYKVELDRPLSKADAQRVLEGVKLEEGRAVVDDLAFLSDDRKTVGLEIHIGWNRVVRRIFETLEYEVVKLDRTAYAGLTKKDLGRGEWRFLENEEIVLLKHF